MISTIAKSLLVPALLISEATAFSAPRMSNPSTSALQMSDTPAKAELEVLAKELNPIVGFYDPLDLSDQDYYDMGNAGTIGFLRHAELKHGRVAMAAFVGYCVQSNWHFPWKMTLAGDDWPSTDLSPEAQWDAIPDNAKMQIFIVILALEIWDEVGGGTPVDSDEPMLPHYTKGRKPGQYPSFQLFRDNVHFVLDLFDPFGFSKRASEEKKAKGRVVEINNGRLAMIGIMGFLAADKTAGSVPFLNGIAIPYDGNVMIPFESSFSLFSDSV